MDGILYIIILIGSIRHAILILINFGILINIIFNWLAQQLRIKNYKKKENIILELRREYLFYKLIDRRTP